MAKASVALSTTIKEIILASIIAFVIALIIKIFFLSAYSIPSSSMEQKLLTGDYILVSKLHYGPRLPLTPLSFPFTHNRLPFTDIPSYVQWIKLPYWRLPGMEDIETGDIVVFNFPGEAGEEIPVDKRTNYVKRCIATPGDQLNIFNRKITLNDSLVYEVPEVQHDYLIKVEEGSSIDKDGLREMNITEGGLIHAEGYYKYALSPSDAEQIRQWENVTKMDSIVRTRGIKHEAVFPYDFDNFAWNFDNYGPLRVPKKGDTISLSFANIKLYKDIITLFEGNELAYDEQKIYINGVESYAYVVKMDYYFMMGDNRHNSLDSRIWGFVPEDHVIGKAWMTWFSKVPGQSLRNGIRWDRCFRWVH